MTQRLVDLLEAAQIENQDRRLSLIELGRTEQLSGGAGKPSILFEIRDTGIGIAPAHLERLFEPFGNTGANVSILSLGGVLKPSDQLVFRQAFKMGVTYWDTADSYGWGKNEKAIGKYFAKFPDHRKNVFWLQKRQLQIRKN